MKQAAGRQQQKWVKRMNEKILSCKGRYWKKKSLENFSNLFSSQIFDMNLRKYFFSVLFPCVNIASSTSSANISFLWELLLMRTSILFLFIIFANFAFAWSSSTMHHLDMETKFGNAKFSVNWFHRNKLRIKIFWMRISFEFI